MAKLGVKKGDKVVLLSSNTPEWVICFLAGIALGAVVCPFDPASPTGMCSQLQIIRHLVNLALRLIRTNPIHATELHSLLTIKNQPLLLTRTKKSVNSTLCSKLAFFRSYVRQPIFKCQYKFIFCFAADI